MLYVVCDAHADALPWALRALERYWPDCPYPVQIARNEASFDLSFLSRVPTYLNMGADDGWVGNMRRLARMLDEPVLLMLEDYLICDVCPRLMEVCQTAVTSGSAGMVRVVPMPGPTDAYDDDLGIIRHNAHYAVSLQAAMWAPDVLARIADAVWEAGGRSAWDFERFGSRLASEIGLPPFLGSWRPAMDYHNYYRLHHKMSRVQTWIDNNLR